MSARVAPVWDRYTRRLPRRVLKSLTLPAVRQLKTADLFTYDPARSLTAAFRFVWSQGVQGDYAEFGVWRGDTFVEAWEAARRYDRETHLYAFDSFEGLPEPTASDREGGWHAGQYASTRTAFEDKLRRRRVPPSRVTIVPGFFDATLRSDLARAAGPAQVAIAWIDCDYYESTVPVLEYLTDRLPDGAVLVFDDWYNFKGRPDRGEQKACAEWLAANPDFRLTQFFAHGTTGRSFIFNRGVSVSD